MTEWWDATTSNDIGAYLGSFSGVFWGGIGGGIGGPLAGVGKAKAFVLGMFWSGIIFGALLAVFAIAAAVLGQPTHVWLWPLIGGLILASVMGAVLPQLRRVYQQADERKLAAEELRRG